MPKDAPTVCRPFSPSKAKASEFTSRVVVDEETPLPADGRTWADARVFDPPAPRPVPGKGFPVFVVEFDSAVLQFSSLDELRVCLRTLSQRVLPSNLRLTRKRGGGPSNHWLNRLPLRAMTWPYRQKVVKYLKASLADFEVKVTGSRSPD